MKILALEIFSFVCSPDSSDSAHSRQERASRLTLPASCTSRLVVFFLLSISFIHFFFLPTSFVFLPVSILSHFCRKKKKKKRKTGGTGVKLMWWKTTGISLWAICFAVMAALSLLSVALRFLLRLGAYCKLASSYLRLPAKCIADLAPCQARVSWKRLHAQLRPKLCFQWRWAAFFDIVSQTCMIHSSHCSFGHIFNIPESIEFIERRRRILNVAS